MTVMIANCPVLLSRQHYTLEKVTIGGKVKRYEFRRNWAIVVGSILILGVGGGSAAYASVHDGASGDHNRHEKIMSIRHTIGTVQSCTVTAARLIPSHPTPRPGGKDVVAQTCVSFPVGLTPPQVESASVSCGAGYVATDGGFALSGPMGIGGNATEKWIPIYSYPIFSNGTESGWQVGIDETGTAGNVGRNYILDAYAICSPRNRWRSF